MKLVYYVNVATSMCLLSKLAFTETGFEHSTDYLYETQDSITPYGFMSPYYDNSSGDVNDTLTCNYCLGV